MSNFENQQNDELIQNFKNNIDQNLSFYYDSDDIEEIVDAFFATLEFSYLEKAIEYGIVNYPTHLFFRMSMVKQLILQFKIEDAEKELNKIEKEFPPFADLYIERVYISQILDQEADIIALLQKALSLEPDNVDAHFLLGREHLQSRNINQALAHVSKALTLDDGFMDQLYSYSQLIEENELENLGVEFFTQLANQFPLHGAVWFALGLVYSGQENFEKALEAYHFSLACEYEIAPLHSNIGNTYFEQTNYDKAIEHYLEAYRIDDVDYYSLSCVGDCLAAQNWDNEALEYYHKALEINKFHSNSILGIVTILKKQNKHDEAFQFFKNTIKNAGNSLDHVTLMLNFLDSNLLEQLNIDEEEIDDTFGSIITKAIEFCDNSESLLYAIIKHCLNNNYFIMVEHITEHFRGSSALPYAIENYYLAAMEALNSNYKTMESHLDIALLLDYDSHTEFLELDKRLSDSPEIINFINLYKPNDEN